MHMHVHNYIRIIMLVQRIIMNGLLLYVQVTFIGKLGLSRDKVQVLIGTFYGRPLPPGPISPVQLFSLEESILSQYNTSKEKLTTALLTYSNHAQRLSAVSLTERYEDEVNHYYQLSFKAQVQLARLRNWRRSREEPGTVQTEQFNIEQLASSVDMATLSASKLIKLIGCIMDTILTLILNAQTRPTSEEKSSHKLLESTEEQRQILSKEDCSLLFSTLCVHGTPKSHARACALLVQLCGSQSWWGHFVALTASELLADSPHTAIFNKDRCMHGEECVTMDCCFKYTV